jgi:outer membrane protein TolC
MPDSPVLWTESEAVTFCRLVCAMLRVVLRLAYGLPFACTALLGGCELLYPVGLASSSPATPQPAVSEFAGNRAESPGVVAASPQAPTSPALPGPAAEAGGPVFPDAAELSVDPLVEQVLARNPTLPQMVAAWQAASARIPQVTSLEDPFFGATVAPASIGSSEVEFGYRLELAQKLPWPGKLGLRGANASAEASAAGNEVEDTRLQLIEAARMAFYDYYLVYRALAVNEEGLKLLSAIRKAVEARFKPGLADTQEIYQVDVEIGRERERRLYLERLRQVAIARLNTLMHLPPDLPLPPPPKELRLGPALPEAAALRAAALSRRPDLLALRNRIAAEEASLGLARREYYPDFDVMAAYDTIMGNGPTRELAPQLAMRVNLPVRTTRRAAAVSEGQSRVAQRHAELARMADQASYEVQQAYEQVREAERVVRLYEKEVLPAARNNVRAAQAAYVPGKIPLIALIEAQRNSVNLQDRYYEAVADYYRRLAMMERATGGSLSSPVSGDPPLVPARSPPH